MTKFGVIALGTAASAAALLAIAAPSSAHVTVTSPGATRGGSDQEITFRVPVENNANTVGFTLALPSDTPIASVQVLSMPGWTHTQKTATLAKPIRTDDGEITTAVSEIDWTAQAGQGLKPGEFGTFTIITGLLPDAPTLTFKAIQTYSDGTSVSWIETPAPGAAAPEHPAPVLTLAPAASTGHPGSTPSTVAATAPPAPTSKSSNTGPVVLSIIALVVAVTALGLGVVSRARGRRT